MTSQQLNEDLPTPQSVAAKRSESRKSQQEAIEQKAARLRADRWINLLGVRNKPDLLADWDNLYNLKNQALLRKDCRELLQRLGQESVWSIPEIESLMTLYCKRRDIGYESEQGWLQVLGILLTLPFDKCNLFNVFWAITTKYIPRSSKIYDLYRLLLQYHDPELCSYLDSFKVQPFEFANEWFSTLLSKNMDDKLCYDFWDRYFEKGDPFLIFFVALAFVQSAKESLLQLKEHAVIIALLKDVPKQMSIDDVHDLLEICFVHMNLTPISVREDFHCMLFGSNLLEECNELPLNRIICLPISAQELYRRAVDLKPDAAHKFSYFIIDTRHQKLFNAGSIPGSYNLNAETIVDDPEKFDFAMKTLMKFKEDNCPKDHICFLGSGREEEDQFMVMAISRFLHQNYEHISYANGGYAALHSILFEIGNLQKLSNHFNKAECIECKRMPQKVESRKGTSIFERLKKSIQSNTKKKKGSDERQKKTQTAAEENVKHVSRTERFGKRYRNVQSVFSLNEDDSLSSSEVDDLHMVEIEPPVKVHEKLQWASIVKKAEIGEHFEGEEVMTTEDEHIPCYIALSRTHMHIFHKVPKEPAFVYPSLRHPLASIIRVTSKRQFPEYLTFKFGYDLPTGESHINRVHFFILPKAGDCAKAVKLAILALKPLALDANGDEKGSFDS